MQTNARYSKTPGASGARRNPSAAKKLESAVIAHQSSQQDATDADASATPEEDVHTLMQKRFTSLWQRCGSADAATADRVFGALTEQYSEHQRRYHVFEHIIHCIKQLDTYFNQISDGDVAALILDNSNGTRASKQRVLDCVELAIWFHDVIYDPCAKNNESASVDWFREQSRGTVEDAVIDKVSRLIMATVHNGAPHRRDEQVVVDIDLSSLGSDWETFARDSHALREEACHLSDQEYVNNQCRFLRRLLDREYIYCIDYFRQRFEQSARHNISTYLEYLQTDYLKNT